MLKAYAGPLASKYRRDAKAIAQEDPARAEELMLRSCKAGAGISCRDYAVYASQKGLHRRAARFYGWGCLANLADSCLLSGNEWTKIGIKKQAQAMYRRGCELKLDTACQAMAPSTDQDQTPSQSTPAEPLPPAIEPEKSAEEINKPVETAPPAVETPSEQGFDYWKTKASEAK